METKSKITGRRKNMPRYAVSITEQELKAKLTELAYATLKTTSLGPQTADDFKKDMELSSKAAPRAEYDVFENVFYSFASYMREVPQLEKDLKIEFDTENVINGNFRTRPDGATLFEFEAGGDWEHPVFVSMYFDGKNVRAYVPTDGNVFDTSEKTALGGESPKKNMEAFVKKTFRMNWFSRLR